MLIVWGTKRVERELEAVADFCPICREIRAFRLVRVGMAGHVYYVSFGQGRLAGHFVRCLTCGVPIDVDSDRFRGSGVEATTDLEAMIQATQPNLRASCEKRLELEAAIKRSPYKLTTEQREQLVLEPFALLNPVVERRYKDSMQYDRRSGLGCLGTIVVGIAALVVIARLPHEEKNAAAAVALVVCGLGAIYSLVEMLLGPGRFVRNAVVPMLVRALAPLKPLREELDHARDLCRSNRWRIGKKVKVDFLWAKLQEPTGVDAWPR